MYRIRIYTCKVIPEDLGYVHLTAYIKTYYF